MRSAAAQAKRLAYGRAYHKRPEVKERAKIYHQRPEVKAREKVVSKLYLSRPEVQSRMKAYSLTPEARAWKKAYRERPEVKARKKALRNINRERDGVKERERLANRAWSLRYKYGIEKADYDRLLVQQGGACAICKTSNWNGKGPVVDHDHLTSKVRGILCHSCNVAVGMINDDPEIGHAMVVYLEKHSGGQNEHRNL